MNISYTFLTFLLLIVNSTIGLFVFVKSPKNIINQAFSLLAFAISTWILSNYLADNTKNYLLALFWTKMTFASTAVFALNLVWFVLNFPLQRKKSTTRTLVLLTPFIFITPLLFSSLIVNNIKIENWGVNVVFGDASTLFAVYFLAYLTASFKILYTSRKQTQGRIREQTLYVLLGLTIFLVLAVTTNLVIPMGWNYFYASKYGHLFSIIFISFTAYAILKHQLMDIKVFIRRGLIFLFLFLSLLTLFTFVHLSATDLQTFLIIMSAVIIAGITAIYFYNKYELKKEKAIAQQRAHEAETLLMQYVLLDNVYNSVYGQAHDLKNPLKTIKAFGKDALGLLSKEAPKDKIEKYLSAIIRNADTLEGELNEFLQKVNRNFVNRDLSYITDFHASAENAYTLKKVLDMAMAEMEDILNLEMVDVRTDIDPRLSPNYISKEMMRYIIKNLFDNSIKALTGASNKMIKVYTEELDEGFFTLNFTDNGKGIDTERLNNIFERGFSASSSSGAGLAIIKEAVVREPVCGDITVESDPGLGTTFILKLRKRVR